MAYSNQVQAAALTNSYPFIVGEGDGETIHRIRWDPAGSLWFHRFNQGCSRRMGQDWCPDQAISAELTIAILLGLELKITEEKDKDHEFLLILAGAYYAACFVLSF